MRPAGTKKFIVFALLLVLIAVAGTARARSTFPVYKVIEPNVLFWEKVYSTYTSRQGILHDKNNPGIIYGVVNLVDWHAPGAARINKKLIKIGRQHYKDILSDLARGRKPQTREEKRIADLFKKYGRPSYRKARENIRLQIGQKDHFLQGVIRSGAYIGAIKRILRAEGLPLELAYLPHVESSFNPKAHSKAAAVGLWQFTKSTGRDYLVINDVVDERYDIYLSSVAAAKFLKENYRQLESWPLALTAYNYGRAGMVRAKRRYGSYPRIFISHNTKLFKFASKNFYSEFIAALRVARRLEKDPSIIRDRPWANATVRLPGYAAVRDLCKYFGVSREDFIRLNPALRKPVLEGKKYAPKGYLLRLPATKTIRNRLKKMPRRLFHTSQIKDGRYRVRRGDTAASIARRFNIPLRDLVRANSLGRKATVRAGQQLKIPGRGGSSARGNKVITLKATAKRKP
jgi:membrane-bound lytic murein transglycosylase D